MLVFLVGSARKLRRVREEKTICFIAAFSWVAEEKGSTSRTYNGLGLL